jgi:thiol:disulfide interchange protein DsbC
MPVEPGIESKESRMKFLAAAVLAALSLSACAQETGTPASAASAAAAPKPPAIVAGTPEARARDVLEQILPGVRIERIGAAPIPGFREVIARGQVVYISDDGQYLMQGKLFDVPKQKDLGEASMAKLRAELLGTIPMRDRIVFAPPAAKHTVVVFTDIECGFCRKLHDDIAEYNKRGIAVQYLAFPRMGLGSEDYRKMVAVWCAKDRRQALTDAKKDRAVPMKTCDTPVDMQYALGQRMGLTGTPMILATDGTQISGYLSPDQLLAAMEQHAATVAAEKAGTAPAVAGGP